MSTITTILPVMPGMELKPKKRVAAYARVSDDFENLAHSLAAQISYYSDYIEKNPDWEFVEIYYDDAVSGRSISKRKAFLRMIKDCDEGKIDIILVKSISRFARNTVDLLETVRHLKDIDVEVRFERENINTLSEDGEFMLSLLASFAEEESRSISENVKWSVRKGFEEGKQNCHKAPFGYYWDGDIYRKVPKEAKTVRRIYDMYLSGQTPFSIARALRREGIKTQSGKEMRDYTIKDIISNRSYTGVMTLQANYINDAHKRMRNKGEIPKFLVEDMYEPIITYAEYERAQNIRNERARTFTKKPTITCFHGKVKCGCCGSAVCRKIDKGRILWKCNRKDNKGIKECALKNISENELYELTRYRNLTSEQVMKIVDELVIYDDRVEMHFYNKKKYVKVRENG